MLIVIKENKKYLLCLEHTNSSCWFCWSRVRCWEEASVAGLSFVSDFVNDRWRLTLNSAISTSNSSQMSLICVYMVGPSTKQDRSVKQLSAVEKQQNLWGWMLCIFSLLLYIQNVEQMYQVSSSSKKPIVVLEGGNWHKDGFFVRSSEKSTNSLLIVKSKLEQNNEVNKVSRKETFFRNLPFTAEEKKRVFRKLKTDQSTIDQIKHNVKQCTGHLALNWDGIFLTQRFHFQVYKYDLHHQLHDHDDHIPQAQLAKTDHPKYTGDCTERSREDGKIQLTFPYAIVDEVEHTGNG
ncbi:hypothetical protein T10_9791 [Trichinella papuae]|uniref:Uncharacterized protein n=1 Tax=Trichinella papuae TaxID=268474 RepID=A0A0V1MJH3_9BILA|nr:hypothetical protein T10_9791 [Trichinella papuae]